MVELTKGTAPACPRRSSKTRSEVNTDSFPTMVSQPRSFPSARCSSPNYLIPITHIKEQRSRKPVANWYYESGPASS